MWERYDWPLTYFLGKVMYQLFSLSVWSKSAVIAAISFCTSVSAQSATPEIPNDKTNYLSDRIETSVAVSVWKVDLTAAVRSTVNACVPAKTSMRGIGTHSVAGKVQPLFMIVEIPDQNSVTAKLFKKCELDKQVVVGEIVAFLDQDIAAIPVSRFGITYGALLIPYKYQLKGDQELGGNTSLAGYVGYRQSRMTLGVELKYIAFLGATKLSVSQTNNGQTSELPLAAVSYGIGLIGTLKNSFQMGLVLGADRVSQSAGYKNNGKPWIAISLGYDFVD
jgi:hypothetical protein